MIAARFSLHRADPGDALSAYHRARADVARMQAAAWRKWLAEMGFVLAMIGVAAMGNQPSNEGGRP